MKVDYNISVVFESVELAAERELSLVHVVAVLIMCLVTTIVLLYIYKKASDEEYLRDTAAYRRELYKKAADEGVLTHQDIENIGNV